jgi:ABC-type polar amino acid transport system ATPase subunit
LDPELRNEVCQVLKKNIKPDSTMFIISHLTMDDKYFDGELVLSLNQANQYEKHTVVEMNYQHG